MPPSSSLPIPRSILLPNDSDRRPKDRKRAGRERRSPPDPRATRKTLLSQTLAAQRLLLAQALPAACTLLPAVARAASRRGQAAQRRSPATARRSFSAAVAVQPTGCHFQQLFHDAPRHTPLVTDA